jgi:hypothetical protein
LHKDTPDGIFGTVTGAVPLKRLLELKSCIPLKIEKGLLKKKNESVPRGLRIFKSYQ